MLRKKPKGPIKRKLTKLLATLTLLGNFITTQEAHATKLPAQEQVQLMQRCNQTFVTIRELEKRLNAAKGSYTSSDKSIINYTLRALGLQINYNIQDLTKEQAQHLIALYKDLIKQYKETFNTEFDVQQTFTPRTQDEEGLEISIQTNINTLRKMLREIEQGKKTKQEQSIKVHQEVITILRRFHKMENPIHELTKTEKTSLRRLNQRIDKIFQEAIHHYGEGILDLNPLTTLESR